MPDDELIEAMAKAINGPHLPVPATSKFTLDQLRYVRWSALSNSERQSKLNEAKAALTIYRTTRPALSEDDAELVKRARKGCACDKCRLDLCCCDTMDELAARIEALSRENAELRGEIVANVAAMDRLTANAQKWQLYGWEDEHGR